MMYTADKLPKPSGRHRGAPALFGDDDALQTEGTEVHSRRMLALQASQASGRIDARQEHAARQSQALRGREISGMIRLALFLLPYAPRRLRPWLMGIAFGRKPEPMEWRDGKWRLPVDSGKVNKALEKGK